MGSLLLEFDPPASRCIICRGEIARWKTKSAYGYPFFYDRCRRCGFVFVNPRPTAKSLGHYYENHATISQLPSSAVSVIKPVAEASQRALIRELFKFRPPPGRFLDVGAGSGLATAAARDAGLTATALEIEPTLIQGIRQLPAVEVIPELFEFFEPGERRFDYIVMSHVLEHTHDPLAFLRKAERMLSPGGILFILLPSFDSIYRYLLGTGDPYFVPPEHLNHFNPRSLANACRIAGLKIRESTDYHALPRNVISKRFPQLLRPAIENATAAGDSIARWLTGIAGWGAFVRCVAQKAVDG